MNQQQRILELVKSGNITVEQGMELLKALGEPERRAPPEPPRPPRPTEPAWQGGKPAAKVGRPLSSGGGQLSFDQIVQLGMYNIKPEFVEQMRQVGLEELGFDTIVKLGMYNIKPSYVLEIRQLAEEMGVPMPSTKKIIELGMYNIKPSYVRDMMKSGVMGLDALSEDGAEFEERRAKLQAKLEKVTSKLDKARTDREREKLEEMSADLQGELDDLEEEIADALKADLEAELDDEDSEVTIKTAKGTGRVVNRSDNLQDSGTKNSLSIFNLDQYVNPDLAAAERKVALEEALQHVNAELGIAQNEEQRLQYLEVVEQLLAAIKKASAELDSTLSA